MAMTGGTAKLVASGTPPGWPGAVNLYVYYKHSQNNDANTSTITCGAYVTTPSGWDIGPWTDFNGSYVGTTSLTFNGDIPNFAGTRWLVENKSFTVKHNADGKGEATIYWHWGVYSGWSGVMNNPSGSFKITLPTIPRATTLNSLSCSTSYFDGTFTYKYTPQSASYYNRCNISLNLDGTYVSIKSINLGKASASQQTKTVTLSSSELTTIYNNLPKTTKGILRFTFRTYSDSGYSTQVGSATYKEITLTIPTSVVPKLGTITLDPVNITTVDGTSQNILVQGKNKVTISVSGCSAGAGSSIKSYKFEVLSGSTVIKTTTVSTTATSASATLGPFSNTGTLKIRLTITDNRRSASNNGSEQTITCYVYDAPSFSSFKSYRCNSSGTADDNGTLIKYELGVNYQSVNSTNKSTVQIYYKKSTASSWTAAANAFTNSTTKSASAIIKNTSGTNITFDSSSTYMVYATVTDNYNGTVKSSPITVFGASRIFNVRPNGSGIAFGKMAESNNLFESKWPAKFDDDCAINGGLTVGISTQSSAPTDGIAVHDVRDATITPDSFGDKNANFYFDQIDSRWMGIIHMKGWTGNYAAWELAGNAHNVSSDNTLKYRQGLGDTWGDWQTVITNKNINNYVDQGTYLPLDGSKALTGKLTLDTNLYYASGNTAGIDCKNSDIININAMYFADASDSAGEAINFYRSDGYWSTLYAYDGVLKFHPNRSTSAGLGGYKIYTSNNFRRGTCTLSSSADTTVTFSSAFEGTPTVLLTPLTTSAGVIPGKVKSASSTGFTAIIGGSAVASAKFAYLAIYY